MPLNQNRAAMKAAGFDAECLDTIERAMGAALSPERQAEIRAEEEALRRKAVRDELDRLKGLADRAEAGAFGPEGKELARRLLAERRSYYALIQLRDAIRRLY